MVMTNRSETRRGEASHGSSRLVETKGIELREHGEGDRVEEREEMAHGKG